MPSKKTPPDAQPTTDKRTPEEIAEERIEKWRTDPFQERDEALVFGSRTGILSLFGLELKVVPESIRSLHEIEVLNLGNNKIREVPYWIGELKALKALGLHENLLRRLPEQVGELRELAILLLSGNRLEALPTSLLRLPLTSLDIEDNPGLGLPESILRRQPKEVLRYYFESKEGRSLLELKLLLVGRGKAGKTTLVKRLAGEAPDESESETHSIAIRELTLECPKGKVRTRAWDFGGQEILHSTHQFFLTERSLYLLVLEPRTGLAARDAEYWLKLIETQGGGSPVIVVLNYSYPRRWPIDKVKLRRKFPFIVDFISTDALRGDGIDELRRTISTTVQEKMRDVWLPFPKHWREIKDAVAGMQENFLTYEQSALRQVRGEAAGRAGGLGGHPARAGAGALLRERPAAA